jgi:hypothetical protein
MTSPTPSYSQSPPPWSGPQTAAPEQFARAVLVSVGAGVAGVAGWAILASSVHVRTALISFAVAAAAFAAFRRFAPHNPLAPAVIVAVTVASALVGLLASQYALLADAAHVSYLTAVRDVPMSKVPKLLTTGTDAFTWIIVVLSVYSGYRQSLRLRLMGRPTTPPPGWNQQPAQDPRSAEAFASLAAANERANALREKASNPGEPTS